MKMLVLLGSTFMCEQTFSLMKFTKSRYRSFLSHNHISAVLCISNSDIESNFYALVRTSTTINWYSNQYQFLIWPLEINSPPLTSCVDFIFQRWMETTPRDWSQPQVAIWGTAAFGFTFKPQTLVFTQN